MMRLAVAAVLVLSGLVFLLSEAVVASAQDAGSTEPVCTAADDPPTPTEVAVTAVPIVVESTAADYFVLYASYNVDGTSLEYPVLVKLGEEGTTTLTENIAALPAARYRVEKYLVTNPADVDEDCIDDITELGNLGAMNPVNPASGVEPAVGATTIVDRPSFETLSRGWSLRFVIVDVHAARPKVYFQNTKALVHHAALMQALELGGFDNSTRRGFLVYDSEITAPGGNRGVYHWRVYGPPSLRLWERINTLLAASMPAVNDNLALWIPNQYLPQIQADLQSDETFRAHVVYDEDVQGGRDFEALNAA